MRRTRRFTAVVAWIVLSAARAAAQSGGENADGLDDPRSAAEAALDERPIPALEPAGPERVDEREVVSASVRTLLGRHGSVWVEVGATMGGPDGNSVVALSPELGLRYRVADSIVADVSWGLTYAATRVSGEILLGGTPTPYRASTDRVEPGNPVLGGAFVHRSESSLVEVGFALGIPTAAREDLGSDADRAAERASSEVAQRAAMALRGYRAALRWAPERISFAVPFRLVVPVAPVLLEVDGALALMVPVLGDAAADVDTIVELGAGAGAEIAGPLAMGVRLAGVGAASGATVPSFTLSAEPWLRLRFDPVQIGVRGVLLLTGDDGLGQSRGPSFGVLVGAGAEL